MFSALNMNPYNIFRGIIHQYNDDNDDDDALLHVSKILCLRLSVIFILRVKMRNRPFYLRFRRVRIRVKNGICLNSTTTSICVFSFVFFFCVEEGSVKSLSILDGPFHYGNQKHEFSIYLH